MGRVCVVPFTTLVAFFAYAIPSVYGPSAIESAQGDKEGGKTWNLIQTLEDRFLKADLGMEYLFWRIKEVIC